MEKTEPVILAVAGKGGFCFLRVFVKVFFSRIDSVKVYKGFFAAFFIAAHGLAQKLFVPFNV